MRPDRWFAAAGGGGAAAAGRLAFGAVGGGAVIAGGCAALFVFFSSSILADGHAGEAKPEMMMLEPIMVNINNASSEDIAVHLKGIGLKTAQAIIDYRNENGDFSSPEDIMNVKGIGEHTFETNKDMIVVE